MDMQDVKNLTIQEGDVKTIHDKDNRLLWGGVGYDTTYKGDTTQQTYSGKNLWNFTGINPTSSVNFTSTFENGELSVNWTGGFDLYPTNGTGDSVALDSSKTYTLSVKTKGSPLVFKVRGGSEIFRTTSTTDYTEFSGSFTGVSSFRIDIIRLQSSSGSASIKELQLESGSTATSYEKFVGGTPSPNSDYPQNVNVVTGVQTVTISDWTNTQTFTIDLGSTELCKIGTYQDKIYTDGTDWYVHKECGEVVLDGSNDEDWVVSSTGTPNFFYRYRYVYYGSNKSAFSNYFSYKTISSSNTDIGFDMLNTNQLRFRPNFAELSLADWKTWLSTHNVIIYYVISTPTDTKITDNTLIGQLNDIHEWLTRYGYNATVSGNLPIIIDRTNL